MKRSMMFLHLTGLAMAGLAMAEEIDNGGGGDAAPWVAGVPLTTGKQPEPGEIGISPSAVPIEVADPAVYRVPRTDETENPVPTPVERVAEAPRLHAVEGRDKWNTTPLTTILDEQRMIRQQEANPVTTVTNAPKTSTGAAGTTVQLTATVAPVGAAPDVTWSTSDATKATVSQTGLVTRVATGTATITATSKVDSTKKDTTAITVS
jgi:uncharacterized protein YjdB